MNELIGIHDIEGGLKTITLNSPASSNALSPMLVESLLKAVRDCYADGTHTLVFTSSGKNFCAGFDLSAIDNESDADLLARFVRIEILLQAVYMAPFDTLACAKGAAYGAGADLFAACRCRIAEPNARFAMPGLQFGVALGTRRLAELVGEVRAYELLRVSSPYGAAHALEIGLASSLETEDQWERLVKERHQSTRLRREALASLARMTRRDTCARDMMALVESASEPGLGQRMRNYRDTGRRSRSETMPKTIP